MHVPHFEIELTMTVMASDKFQIKFPETEANTDTAAESAHSEQNIRRNISISKVFLLLPIVQYRYTVQEF